LLDNVSYGQAAPLTIEQVHLANIAQMALATGWSIEYILSLDLKWYGVMKDVMHFNEDRTKLKPR
jgi:hypothetical protein